MKFGSKKWVLTFACAILALPVYTITSALPAYGSIQGDYSGNFLTGKQGGGAYSYIHTSTSAKKHGEADYNQYAGGSVIFAMDNRDGISFTVDDFGADGLSDGDKINLDFTVDLLKFDGSLNTTNTLLDVVATLSLKGSLTVGGTPSDIFDDAGGTGIHNITAADTSDSFAGLDYTVTVTDAFSIGGKSYAVGDEFTGDAFFQSGKLAGPFNGISFDNTTDTISFAIWGDSRNQGGNTGKVNFDSDDDDDDHQPLGFDIFIEAAKLPAPGPGSIVPEASSVLVWSLLFSMGLISLRRRGKSSC